MDGFSIVMDKKYVNTDLLLLSEPSLPQAMRMLNQCYAFAGLYHGRQAAVCLVDRKDRYYDIVNLAVAPDYRGKGIAREMLTYALDFVRVQGGRVVESGCSNASLPMFYLLQRLGFRLVGVWPDYYLSAGGEPVREQGIVRRDMLRFRLELGEPQFTAE